MALRHFVRLARQIRLGGRRLLGRHLGGRWYTVAPLSVLRWTQLSALLEPLSPGGLTSGVRSIMACLPASALRAFLPLLVSGPIREQDLRRATKSQALAAWDAFLEIHDLDWIEARRQGVDEDGSGPSDFTLDDLAFLLCRETQGAYTVDDLLRLPMVEFLALADSWRRAHNASEGRPPDCDAPTEQERNDLRKRLAIVETLGVKVD